MQALHHTRAIVLIWGLLLSAQTIEGLAASLSVKSPATQVDLIELYTSEGCSSCPPADRWLSGLQGEPGLWRDFIPVAFHVDYWDYIGWIDRFASPAYTTRQYTYAAQQSMRTVYTPGFFHNGKEWRWRSSKLKKDKSEASVGTLALDVKGQSVNVHFDTDQARLNLVVNIALLGFDISTTVKAGENTGRTLTHNFVVLSIAQAKLEHNGRHYAGTLPVPQSDINAQRYALVAWVNRIDNQDPLQAVGGWLIN